MKNFLLPATQATTVLRGENATKLQRDTLDFCPDRAVN